VRECTPLFSTALNENCLQQTPKCTIDDGLGISWEKTRAAMAHKFVVNFIQDPFVAITSAAGQEIIRMQDFGSLWISICS
jgi:nicotinamide mononucleotide (NMN) deamidase PncC